jgi:carboxyl-terminal processing protease
VRAARAAALAALLALVGTTIPARAGQELNPVDLVDLEVAYDTLTTQFYQHVAPQRLIDGARVGIVAYLRGIGIANPQVPLLRANGRYAHDLHVPGQEVGQAALRYGARVDGHALVYAAIGGEIAALHDQYTDLFSAEQEHAFYTFLNPVGFGGIGAILHVDASGAGVIDEVFPGGPAEHGGLRAGDAIVAIDGVATKGMTLDALQRALRGKPGSVVRLSYLRDGSAADAPAGVVRAKVTPPDVLSRSIDGVGYVQLLSYGTNAAQELREHLRRLDAAGARAYVLDLRDDGGGYRDVAIDVTSNFVPRGAIVIMQARNGKRTTLASSAAPRARKPLVVLVNGNTASAAEITASAIAETGSGILVGARTYGKGLVQQMFPLPDGGAMKVTVERYLTVAGHDIDRRGIAPDIAVVQPPDAVSGDPARDPQLARALALAAAAATATPAPAQTP